jgi:hypothetical protein
MRTKKRKNMYVPIPGTVICKGHLYCNSVGRCLHSKLHKWIPKTKYSSEAESCYNSAEHATSCNCIPMTKEGLLLEAY